RIAHRALHGCFTSPQQHAASAAGELDRKRRAPGAGAEHGDTGIGMRHGSGLAGVRLVALLVDALEVDRLQQYLREAALEREIRDRFAREGKEILRAENTGDLLAFFCAEPADDEYARLLQ